MVSIRRSYQHKLRVYIVSDNPDERAMFERELKAQMRNAFSSLEVRSFPDYHSAHADYTTTVSESYEEGRSKNVAHRLDPHGVEASKPILKRPALILLGSDEQSLQSQDQFLAVVQADNNFQGTPGSEVHFIQVRPKDHDYREYFNKSKYESGMGVMAYDPRDIIEHARCVKDAAVAGSKYLKEILPELDKKHHRGKGR